MWRRVSERRAVLHRNKRTRREGGWLDCGGLERWIITLGRGRGGGGGNVHESVVCVGTVGGGSE